MKNKKIVSVQDERNYLFDNIKAILIFCVVWVHLCSATVKLVTDIISIETIMLIICTFHMPLFIFITGFFSKGTTKSKLNYLVLQYAIIELLFMIVEVWVVKEVPLSKYTIWRYIEPGFSMWYMFAIILLKFAFMNSKRSKGYRVVIALIPISVLIMAAPMSGAIDIAIVKTIANSVFFALGYYCTDDVIRRFRRIPRLLYLLAFVISCTAIYFGCTRLLGSHEVRVFRSMFLKTRSIQLFDDGGYAFGIYLIMILVAIFMAFCIIGFMPERKTLISKFGKNSLTIYIAQAVAFEIYRTYWNTVYDDIRMNFIVATMISFGIVLFFGSDLIFFIYQRVVELIRKCLVFIFEGTTGL